MNLSQLYYFRTLARLQHYTKAAAELFIAQSTLSNAMANLERELGVPLFARKGGPSSSQSTAANSKPRLSSRSMRLTKALSELANRQSF